MSGMKSEYSADQYQTNYPDGIEQHWWNIARNRRILRLVGRHAIAGPILEVGCGRGIVVAHLRQHGIPCDGVELAPAVPVAGASDFVVTNTDALLLPAEQRASYRTILMLDVVE